MTTTKRWQRGRGWSTPWVALARFANALYFLLTASYCVLTYSSFAYQQFLRPRLVASLTAFIVWHPLWHWLALGITVLTLRSALERGSSRWLARGYVAVMTALGIVLSWQPVLPSVENDGWGLKLAVWFLLPPLWLAIIDHVQTAPRVTLVKSDEGRVLCAALSSAAVIWVCELAAVPFRLQRLGDLPLGEDVLVFGAVASLVVHLAVFGILAMATIVALRLTKTAAAEYWAIAGLSFAGVWLIVDALIFRSLSFAGWPAALLAAELGLVLVAVWSGVARAYVASDFSRHESDVADRSALAAWFAPFGATSPRIAVSALVALPFASFLLVQRASTFDWNFLLQNLVVVATWLATMAAMFAALPTASARVRAVPMLMAGGVLLATGVARGPAADAIDARLTSSTFVPEFALDAYAAVEPSYRLLREWLLVESPEAGAFNRVLRANSLIQHVSVSPIAVDFVPPPMVPVSMPPDIYLFVIDSLRPDYLTPYNESVAFTPSVAAFAGEPDTFTFEKHFARYGGTGLAMPAMWAGGMVLHKEYVLPFAPMNALGKLLAANHYHSIFSLDHITHDLVAPDLQYEELDRGRDEMQYDFCTTLDELAGRLSREVSKAPIFAHTRSLNLHVSKLRNDPDQGSDPRLFAPAARAIARMDGCFGRFIDALKTSQRYERSIIIVTSDHGDSLGEGSRWGHANLLFPEILRTPLLMHVPTAWRRDLVANVEHVSFSTDLAPTLYALLGYQPRAPNAFYGTPLFVPAGSPALTTGRDRVLVASSYGPTYGLVDHDGRQLYITDGLNDRDYAYELSPLGQTRVGVTPERRAESRAFIRARVEELSAMYHFTPAP